MTFLTSSILILILGLPEQLLLIDKSKPKIYTESKLKKKLFFFTSIK